MGSECVLPFPLLLTSPRSRPPCFFCAVRRAIQELQTLDDAPEAPPPTAAPPPEPEPEAEDPEDQKAVIEMLLKKRDELMRMQVSAHTRRLLRAPKTLLPPIPC